MKKKSLNTKLNLNKVTVAQMNEVKGGIGAGETLQYTCNCHQTLPHVSCNLVCFEKN